MSGLCWRPSLERGWSDELANQVLTKSASAEPSGPAHDAGGDGPAPGRRWMSARRRQGAVLRLLRGEDLKLVAGELRVTAADLSDLTNGFSPGRSCEPESAFPGCPGGTDCAAGGEARRGHHKQRGSPGEDHTSGERPTFGPAEVEAHPTQHAAWGAGGEELRALDLRAPSLRAYPRLPRLGRGPGAGRLVHYNDRFNPPNTPRSPACSASSMPARRGGLAASVTAATRPSPRLSSGSSRPR